MPLPSCVPLSRVVYSAFFVTSLSFLVRRFTHYPGILVRFVSFLVLSSIVCRACPSCLSAFLLRYEIVLPFRAKGFQFSPYDVRRSPGSSRPSFFLLCPALYTRRFCFARSGSRSILPHSFDIRAPSVSFPVFALRSSMLNISFTPLDKILFSFREFAGKTI